MHIKAANTVKNTFHTRKDNETPYPSMQQQPTPTPGDAGVDVVITYDGRKELRSRAASGHEGSPCHVLAEMETL